MNSRMTRYGNFAAFLIILTILLTFSWLTLDVNFPANKYVSTTFHRQLTPTDPYNNIASNVSRFLWENRALDLTGQAFVIVAAVICCLAMLKSSEEGG